MSAFEIVGGNKLKGEVIPQGAKNEALQVICAVLLTAEKVDMSNIPEIIDVLKLIDLLKDMGVKVEKLGKGHYTFQKESCRFARLHHGGRAASGALRPWVYSKTWW